VPYPSFASRSCKYFTREPVKPQDFSSKKCVNVNAMHVAGLSAVRPCSCRPVASLRDRTSVPDLAVTSSFILKKDWGLTDPRSLVGYVHDEQQIMEAGSAGRG